MLHAQMVIFSARSKKEHTIVTHGRLAIFHSNRFFCNNKAIKQICASFGKRRKSVQTFERISVFLTGSTIV